MPGLKHASTLANDRLIVHLQPYGYTPVKHTPSLWRHTSNGIIFTLVVDDFGSQSTPTQTTYSKHYRINTKSLWIQPALNI